MCGIIGVYSLKDKTRNVYPLVIKGLLDLQHRGQLSAGILLHKGFRDAAVTIMQIIDTSMTTSRGIAQGQTHLHTPLQLQYILQVTV
jgi:glutamine phosphoribosylpyrophosphate amidotransferase